MAIITEIRRKLPLRHAKEIETDSSVATPSAAIHHINIDDIVPNRSQPRSVFNQNAILRLSDSIRRYGILQPLTVRKVMLPLNGGDRERRQNGQNPVIYEPVAGERRLRAAKIAEMTTVPCIIINTDDATCAELAIIENLLRENLNMFEQAEAFSRLIHEFHLTLEEAARRVSMSQSAVANKLRILRLLPEEREKILQNGLTERHARALLKCNDPCLRADVLNHIIENKCNVSATETYIDRIVCELSRYEYRTKGQNSKETTQFEAAEAQFSDPNLPEDEIQTLPPAVRSVMERRKARFKGSIKDLQLFYNSIRNAMLILENTGVAGNMKINENEDRVELTITLSRHDQVVSQ
jgi:ParB family chromosome partitioning protein